MEKELIIDSFKFERNCLEDFSILVKDNCNNELVIEDITKAFDEEGLNIISNCGVDIDKLNIVFTKENIDKIIKEFGFDEINQYHSHQEQV
jgi:hypothetical protein